MAIGADYVTRQELKAYMSLELNTNDVLLDDAIDSASREIELHCGRQFNKAGTATARVYRPLSAKTLFVDDFHTTDGLVVEVDEGSDGTFDTAWVLGTDFELHPLNGVRDGRPGWPYWRIEAIGPHRFHHSKRATVRVTADWGWAEVPRPVRQACFILASETYQLKDSRMGIAGSDHFGTIVRVRDNGIAARKLQLFARGKTKVNCADACHG